MQIHFKEKDSKFSYEFIEDENFPERELVTCVFAMLYKGIKIYLTKNYRGWELPGGHIEKGENFEEALEKVESKGTRKIIEIMRNYKSF